MAAKRESNLWDDIPAECMTPIENTLYLHLRKICRNGRIDFTIEHSIGNYRVDALTAKGVAFEADGKEFHQDRERDNRRDKWLLENASRYGVNLHTIIRIPGAVLWNHEFAARVIIADVLGVTWPLECDRADDIEDAVDALTDCGDACAMMTAKEHYMQASCFGKCDACFVVGNPLAFISCNHPFLSFCPFNPKLRKVSIVEVKRLDNVRRWNSSCSGFPLGWRRRNEA